jgi:hypothetical protein
MPLIVRPRYRWLNTLLASLYGLAALVEIVQASTAEGRKFHLALAALFGFLAYQLYRIAPWAYLAVFFTSFISLVAILRNLDVLGIYGFAALLITGIVAWCAIFIRQNLVVPL